MGDYRVFQNADRWLDREAKANHVAISSRARYARNLAGFPFVPHAQGEVLARVESYISERLAKSERFSSFERIPLAELSDTDRTFLKESRLISKEMERAGAHLTAFLSPDAMASILVNEEDHLRIQVLAPGLDLDSAVNRLNELDAELSGVVGYAHSEKFGYLTACPTNVGTGLRASAMLHLPGLTLLQEVESSLRGLAHYGLTVRGFYGENTEFLGDLYQISNEMTLGKRVEEIIEILRDVIGRIVDREEEARQTLLKHHVVSTEDSIWRSYGLLRHARKVDSTEAMKLLSRMRLGIGREGFQGLTHQQLNRLIMEVQPAHLERRREKWGKSTTRDEARARHLRAYFDQTVANN